VTDRGRTERPNILVIMSDQHNPHFLGCAGDVVVDTPALDGLARRGVTFSSAYCAAPICGPSRMSFLTSQYPVDLAIWTNNVLLDPYVPTFAHQLARANYRTALCGRMHFEDPDQNHGFERRLIGDVNGARDLTRPLFEERLPIESTDQEARSLALSGGGSTSYMVYDREVTRRAIGLLTDWDSADDDKPFCLVVGYLSPHNPYICPPDLYHKYADRLDSSRVTPPAIEEEHPAVRRLRVARGCDKVQPRDALRALAAYYGLVEYLDGCVNEILATLERTRFSENTIIVYVSDHGDMAAEHGLWWKDTFYEGSVGVPMIWSWPGSFRQNIEISEPVSLLDVAPTLLDLGRAERLPGCRGVSLADMLTTDVSIASEPRPVFSEVYPAYPTFMDPGRMVRLGNWKLCHYHNHDHPILFDLESDPGELADLGNSKEYSKVRDSLTRLVTDGWSGKRVIKDTDLRAARHRVIADWHARTEVQVSEIWTPPLGSNWRMS
jgi:choline-sulfatase